MTTERTEYWMGPGHVLDNGNDIELRARIALVLIEKWGTVAAQIDGEDSAGRSRLALQEPAALVERCFDIAEEFVRMAEGKGLLRQPAFTRLELAEQIGVLHGTQRVAEYAVSLDSRRQDATKA